MSKLKLNFATRATGGRTVKSENSNAYNAERANVQAMINSAPVRIDRSVFKKTEIERVELINAKSKWKRSLK